ncbi:MAG: bifunctional phosphoglucose/phosphomannose isomerase [Candidatus Pacebacteria bacterium]|nr:bifunctional phosphoglucose/phosphomannose isomerase [Candidatus Paceibacterota bacterium]
MKNIIEDFPKQFLFKPKIINKEKLKKYDFYIVIGMGGSHLSADVLKTIKPELPIIIHKNYGLPEIPNSILKKSLVILSSYSGNTEEVIDAYLKAKNKKISVFAISIGGKLLEMAKKDKIPYIQMPDLKIQPRFALGLTIKSLLEVIGDRKLIIESSNLSLILNPKKLEKQGKKIAEEIFGYVPIIYSSEKNMAIAYNWKIKFNENSKIPAFYNVFPELNHNEMTGFDIREKTKNLSEKFYFLLLKDKNDNFRIIKRMEVLKKLFKKRNLKIKEINLSGENDLEKVFSSLLLADWVSYYLSLKYNVENIEVPMVEEFKKLIKE